MTEASSEDINKIRSYKVSLFCLVMQFPSKRTTSIKTNLPREFFSIIIKLTMTEVYSKDKSKIHS